MFLNFGQIPVDTNSRSIYNRLVERMFLGTSNFSILPFDRGPKEGSAVHIKVSLVANPWFFCRADRIPQDRSPAGPAHSARPQGESVAAAIEFRSSDGKVLHNATVPIGASDASRAGLVLKGILEALSIAKSLGGKRITIAADDFEAVCVASKRIDAPHELIPTYLQVRALMHQYQWVNFVWTPSLDEFFSTAADGCPRALGAADADARASA